MPVFNREDLTRQCLATLLPTLEGAGTGEVIVVDNGSKPATAEVLAAFPWVKVIRNERNLGFAAACNQGARAAQGRIVVHLNNDIVAHPQWLARMLAIFVDEPNVGIVGARLFFPDGTIQHAGVVTFSARLSAEGAGPYHIMWRAPGDKPGAQIRADFDVVTGACLAVPRDLFLELGGFDEVYWNGYEDVDFCFRVRERGLRVMYEPSATLIHFESQSGIQRKRRVIHNVRELAERWATKIAPDDNSHCEKIGYIRRELFIEGQRSSHLIPIPSVSILVHGPQPSDVEAFVQRLRPPGLPVPQILWAAEGPAPAGTREPRWLHELINAAEFATDICAVTVVPQGEADFMAMPMTVDARCSLIALRTIPQHVKIDTAFDSPHGAIAAWIERAVVGGGSIRIARRGADLGPEAVDAAFERVTGRTIAQARRPDPDRLEVLSTPDVAFAPRASIVMLSWNAPEYTEMALASIREHTHVPYEVIIVDNGSNPETVARVAALEAPDVRLVFNRQNLGFAVGCNQGMAAATGTHVVLLNNDVLVTAGWLDALLAAHQRDPRVGISAPRSNRVAGHQQISEGQYGDLSGLAAFAQERSKRFRDVVYATDRVIGFCMCISRDVIEQIGGIDPRYGIGNFEDDDYCVRVRAAGYKIVVCEDSFIHHFGSVSFAANNVDYRASMEKNWAIFAERWGLPAAYPVNGYNASAAIMRGFDPAAHYIALPALKSAAIDRVYRVAMIATVGGEADWNRLAPLVANFLKAFDPVDPVRLVIGVEDGLDAMTIGDRVLRAAKKHGRDEESAADIDIIDVERGHDWRAAYRADRTIDVETLAERSPSALVRLLRASGDDV